MVFTKQRIKTEIGMGLPSFPKESTATQSETRIWMARSD
jgi:hypothetical protein